MSDMVKYSADIWSFLKLTALYFTMSDIVHISCLQYASRIMTIIQVLHRYIIQSKKELECYVKLSYKVLTFDYLEMVPTMHNWYYVLN